MDNKTKSPEDIKVTERINKLCAISKSSSEKDTITMSYIVEKVSRISSVTFLLADVLESGTELRKGLERCAIGLVKDASNSAVSAEVRALLSHTLLQLVSLLTVAQRSGKLSKMNCDLLSDEIVALGEVITTSEWHRGRRYMEEALFGGDIPREIFSPEPSIQRTETPIRHTDTTIQTRPYAQEAYKDRESQREERDMLEHERTHFRDRVQEVQKDRRATILGLVQKKDRINVKDVANVIKDCSEKTLQRELLALVRQGVLKKEGERRWSVYSLR